jgi:S-adenosylmethionine hydrolase
MSPVIALLTDFGLRDHYVGVMKGVMLKRSPDLCFIDISHSIDPFHIPGASYLLYASWHYMPGGTVFLSVVDPGVGTDRKALIYSYNNRFLVTPDNGTISLLQRMQKTGTSYIAGENILRKVRQGTSNTFHGRDLFAPLAAFLAHHGIDSLDLTRTNPVLLDAVSVIKNTKEKRITGTILHIDHFGNCITSIHQTDFFTLPPQNSSRDSLDITLHCPLKIKNGSLQGTSRESFSKAPPPSILKAIPRQGEHIISFTGLKTCFSDVQVGEPLVYRGSSGFIEIAIREGNAAKKYQLKRGMKVILIEES